jgi:hypothetical protein
MKPHASYHRALRGLAGRSLLTLVAPFIAEAICSLLRNVCIRSETAWSCTLICVNFCTYRRVRTRSFARILHAFYPPTPFQLDVTMEYVRGRTMLPAFAFFLISIIVFFSCDSSLEDSRSSSRTAFCRDRWCCRSRSAGVRERPKRVSCERQRAA